MSVPSLGALVWLKAAVEPELVEDAGLTGAEMFPQIFKVIKCLRGQRCLQAGGQITFMTLLFPP